MKTVHAGACAKPTHSLACRFVPLGVLSLVFASTTGCGETADVDEGGTTDAGGATDAGDATSDGPGTDDGGGADDGGADDGGADDGGADDGGADDPGWNPVTCRVDDDGSSSEPGGLEVLSQVLAPDSSPDANDGTTVYYPAIMETETACTFKVIGWGNGTTGFGGADYPAYFNHLASYGFVVAVAHTNATLNASQPILTSIGLAMEQAEDSESVFFGKLDQEFGLMGKSQGAIAVGRELAEPDALAGVLIASGSAPDAALTKPGLFITGDSDFAQPFVVGAYEAATGPAVLAQAAQEDNPEGDPSAGHQDLNEREGAVELSTSFMRCHLQENDVACSYVECESCQVEPWSLFEIKG